LVAQEEVFMELDRLYQMDCVEGLGQLKPASVDLAFADPPFNIGYEYDVYKDRRGREQYLSWTTNWGRAVERVLKPTGALWLAIGDEYAAELKLIFQDELGFRCRSWVVWYYTFGVNCTKKFSRSHAHLFHFVKNLKKFTFNSQDIRVPSARQLVYKDSRGNPDGRLPDDTWVLRPQDLPEAFQPDEDTWYFSRVCGTFKERAGWHGCQMPEQLLGRIIRVSSNPGDLVLDPFAGSGTTLVVAKKLGRRWIGIELSPNYAARVQARLEAATVGEPLEGAEEPKVSAPQTPAQMKNERSQVAPLRVTERREPADVRRGIIEAFFSVREGFSADRVIADPELNGAFLDMCRRLGLKGSQFDWNRQLMNLRKAGCFKGIPTPKRTRLTPQELDDYSYACEIGLRHLKEQEKSLDHVLCDPCLAAEFDQYVQSMVSEPISSFKIRWVALYVRKRAEERTEARQNLLELRRLPLARRTVSSLDCDKLPQAPALYWMRSQEKKLYVGETRDLQRRFHLQFAAPKFGFWGTELSDLEFRFCGLTDLESSSCELSDNELLKASQSQWINRWKPLGNFYLDWDFAA
jgi:DNA modification methylase